MKLISVSQKKIDGKIAASTVDIIMATPLPFHTLDKQPRRHFEDLERKCWTMPSPRARTFFNTGSCHTCTSASQNNASCQIIEVSLSCEDASRKLERMLLQELRHRKMKFFMVIGS